MNISISERDKKLLLILAFVAMAVLPYFLLIQKVVEKNDALQKENDALRARRSELQGYAAAQPTYISETERMIAEADEILKCFPSEYEQEADLMFLNKVETHIPILLTQVAFGEDTSAKMVSEGDREQINEVEEEMDWESTDGEHIEQNIEEKAVAADLIQQKVTTTYNYSASYEGYGQFLNYLKSYKDRMVVSNMTATYRDDVDRVTGSFTLLEYALVGTGRDNFEFNPPDYRQGSNCLFMESTGKYDDTAPADTSSAYASDFFLLVNQPEADMDAVIVGQTSDNTRSTYVTADENESHSVVVTFAGTDGNYEVYYTIDGKANNVGSISFSASGKIRFDVMSAERAGKDDKVDISLRIINDSDLPVSFAVDYDDINNPRVDYELEGDITER